VYWDAWYSIDVLRLAVRMLNQLFKTLCEMMQGPCVGNQAVLSTSNLMDAVSGVWDAMLKALEHHPMGRSGESSAAFGRWDPLSELLLEEVSRTSRVFAAKHY
jgi:RyR and IP3R Homology associated